MGANDASVVGFGITCGRPPPSGSPGASGTGEPGQPRSPVWTRPWDVGRKTPGRPHFSRPAQPTGICGEGGRNAFFRAFFGFRADCVAGCAKSDGQRTSEIVVDPREQNPAEGRDELARRRQDSRRSPSSPQSLSLALLPRSTGFQPVPIGFSRVAEEGLREPHEVVRRNVFGADVRR